MTARDTTPEVEFPEIEAKVAAAAIAGRISPDAEKVLFSIALGCFEHDRTIQDLRTRLQLTDEDAETASRLIVEMSTFGR